MQWTLERWKISSLSFNEKNPRRLRKHEAKHLQESLDRFGQCQPVVINRDGKIIGGHQRVRLLKKRGDKEVDVYVPNEEFTEKEEEELNIRLNRATGEWDYDILANDWDQMELLEWGFELKDFEISDKLEEPKPKKCSLTVNFTFPDHLDDAKEKIQDIVDGYEGATIKVKR